MNFTSNLCERDRDRISKMLLTLFEYWKLSSEDQLGVLGCSKEFYEQLIRSPEEVSLLDNRDLFERADLLLVINKSLHRLFPQNRNLANLWMTAPNQFFNGFTPIKVVQERGIQGLYSVRDYLIAN